MKKAELVEQIITSLTESLAVLEKAARASHEEATHESSKAESKYDTRGLEAAYLAGGQARQAKEILDSIKAYEALVPRDFTPGEPVELTALVELDADGTRSTYFIGPKSGGLEIKHRRKEIMVITPDNRVIPCPPGIFRPALAVATPLVGSLPVRARCWQPPKRQRFTRHLLRKGGAYTSQATQTPPICACLAQAVIDNARTTADLPALTCTTRCATVLASPLMICSVERL